MLWRVSEAKVTMLSERRLSIPAMSAITDPSVLFSVAVAFRLVSAIDARSACTTDSDPLRNFIWLICKAQLSLSLASRVAFRATWLSATAVPRARNPSCNGPTAPESLVVKFTSTASNLVSIFDHSPCNASTELCRAFTLPVISRRSASTTASNSVMIARTRSFSSAPSRLDDRVLDMLTANACTSRSAALSLARMLAAVSSSFPTYSCMEPKDNCVVVMSASHFSIAAIFASRSFIPTGRGENVRSALHK